MRNNCYPNKKTAHIIIQITPGDNTFCQKIRNDICQIDEICAIQHIWMMAPKLLYERSWPRMFYVI